MNRHRRWEKKKVPCLTTNKFHSLFKPGSDISNLLGVQNILRLNASGQFLKCESLTFLFWEILWHKLYCLWSCVPGRDKTNYKNWFYWSQVCPFLCECMYDVCVCACVCERSMFALSLSFRNAPDPWLVCTDLSFPLAHLLGKYQTSGEYLS